NLRGKVNFIKRYKNKQYFKNKFASNVQSNNLWRIYEELNENIKDADKASIPILFENNKEIQDFKMQTEIFMNSFETTKDIYRNDDIKNFKNNISISSQNINTKITPTDITKVIGKINFTNTANDIIQTQIVLKSIKSLAVPFSILFTNCLNLGAYPDNFKVA